MQSSLYADTRHAATCGGPADLNPSRRAGLSDLARSLFQFIGLTRSRTDSIATLNDHLLQDIGLIRADVQALDL